MLGFSSPLRYYNAAELSTMRAVEVHSRLCLVFWTFSKVSIICAGAKVVSFLSCKVVCSLVAAFAVRGLSETYGTQCDCVIDNKASD